MITFFSLKLIITKASDRTSSISGIALKRGKHNTVKSGIKDCNSWAVGSKNILLTKIEEYAYSFIKRTAKRFSGSVPT